MHCLGLSHDLLEHFGSIREAHNLHARLGSTFVLKGIARFVLNDPFCLDSDLIVRPSF